MKIFGELQRTIRGCRPGRAPRESSSEIPDPSPPPQVLVFAVRPYPTSDSTLIWLLFNRLRNSVVEFWERKFEALGSSPWGEYTLVTRYIYFPHILTI